MKKTETITTTVVVDDFTGKHLGDAGWTLIRRRDGDSIDFQSIARLAEEIQIRPCNFVEKYFPGTGK